MGLFVHLDHSHSCALVLAQCFDMGARSEGIVIKVFRMVVVVDGECLGFEAGG